MVYKLLMELCSVESIGFVRFEVDLGLLFDINVFLCVSYIEGKLLEMLWKVLLEYSL